MKPIRTIVVDDHDIIRYALKQLFSQHTEEFVVEIVGEADNGRRAVQLVEQLKPDLVIMDIAMPELNGIEATRRLREEMPSIAVVALSMHEDKSMIAAMRDAGAVSYIPNGGASEELSRAIREAHCLSLNCA